MIKFPYGISDFYTLRTEGYLYLDRTAAIPDLEQAGKQLIWLRPRRFGKSLLLSTLAHYYDIKQTPHFATLFGDLAIAKTPTAERNRYLILRLDFSRVAAQGNSEHIKNSLFTHLNEAIKGFIQYYQDLLKHSVTIQNDALGSLQSLFNAVKNSGYQVYLLIDEYDNFANEVLVQDVTQQRYYDLLAGEGVVKSLFKLIKSSASEGQVARVLITGVSPLVLSDLTSGYNVATSIYLETRFNELCGLTHHELIPLVEQVLDSCKQPKEQVAVVLETMRQFYNGYRFCENPSSSLVYNPTLVFYFLRHYQLEGRPPRRLLDSNLTMDASRIRYIAQLPKGAEIVERVLDEEQPLLIPYLESQFGVEHLHKLHNDPRYMLSLLYFFGVLTIKGTAGEFDELALAVPNQVIYALYVEALREKILPTMSERQTVEQLARQFYQTAQLAPLAEYLEQGYFRAFNNRDYRWGNELTIKTAFMSLLFNDDYYLMDSELALERRYADLVMTVRPDMRYLGALKDIVLEFKYLTLADLGLSAESIRTQTRDELKQLPLVQSALNSAVAQLQVYQQALVEHYQQPERLACMAVVALGFERVVWQSLD